MLLVSVCSSQRRQQCNEIRSASWEMDREHQQQHDRTNLPQESEEVGPGDRNEVTFSQSCQHRIYTSVRHL